MINCCIFKGINSLFIYLPIKVCVRRMIRLNKVKYRWQSDSYHNNQVSDVIEELASGNLQRFTVRLPLRWVGFHDFCRVGSQSAVFGSNTLLNVARGREIINKGQV